MAKSYRTLREDRVAERSASSVRLKIVCRHPRDGDHHPLSKTDLESLLFLFPKEAIHGLRRIELRARNHEIGSPFALYRRGERSIILYSLTGEWRFPDYYPALASEVRRAGAVVSREEKGMRVLWTDFDHLRIWFLIDVLAHEIGHHFEHQFRHKNGRSSSMRGREAYAELTSQRFRNRLKRILKKKGEPGATDNPGNAQ